MTSRPYLTRLLVWSWLALFAALTLIFWRYGEWLGEELVTETTVAAWKNAEIIHWLIEDKAPYADERALQERVTDLGRRFGLRVTYIVNGKVRADSDVPFEALASLEDHSNRPEVVQALAQGHGADSRRSATLGRQLLYAAKRADDLTPGAGPGILRLASPYFQISEQLNQIWLHVLLIFLPTSACAALLTYLLIRSMGRTMRSFTEAVRAIGEGDYESRIRVPPGPEFQPLAQSINDMAKKIRRHIKTITDERSQRDALFDGLAEGLAVLDHDGRIEAHNQALTRFLPEASLSVGRFPLEATLNLELQQAVNEYLVERARDKPAVLSLTLGQTHVELRITPFEDRKGRRKLILAFHDVTEIKNAEITLRQFLIQASHHLRTPLTSVKGYAETLRDGVCADPQESRRLLDVIVRNADVMSGVITNMLAMASRRDLTATPPTFAAKPGEPGGASAPDARPTSPDAD